MTTEKTKKVLDKVQADRALVYRQDFIDALGNKVRTGQKVPDGVYPDGVLRSYQQKGLVG